MLCGGCVSSDEDCLPPKAPTGADVSFFSTLGCSLRGALTSGSMALALLSPFIWSERALAPVLVCRWPSYSPGLLSLPELPWQLAATTSSRQTTSPWAPQTHARPPQTHTSLRWVAVMHLDADATQPPFFFPFFLTLTCTPPRLFLHPFLPVCLCRSHSLSGVFSPFLWSLESGRRRSSSWRGTSCGPEWLQRQLTLVIQHVTIPAAAPTPASSGMVDTSETTSPTSC